MKMPLEEEGESGRTIRQSASSLSLIHIFGFHAEDENIIRELRMRYQDRPWNLDLHDKARPYYAELIAIQNAVALSKASGCPLHICHLSIPEGAGLLKRAKADGVDVTAVSYTHLDVYKRQAQSLPGQSSGRTALIPGKSE